MRIKLDQVRQAMLRHRGPGGLWRGGGFPNGPEVKESGKGYRVARALSP